MPHLAGAILFQSTQSTNYKHIISAWPKGPFQSKQSTHYKCMAEGPVPIIARSKLVLSFFVRDRLRIPYRIAYDEERPELPPFESMPISAKHASVYPRPWRSNDAGRS
jgi:hypothetical protein